MGLRMENIHNPSVASSRLSGGEGASQKSLMELISEKDKIEAELKALSDILDSHNVNMNTSLTTFDGFPRDDIDIAQVRTTRARIINLRNDYKAIMSQIETGLHAHHANVKDETAPSTTSAVASPSGTMGQSLDRNAASAPVGLPHAPFAKVNSVISGSPADDAGLKAGDELLSLGSVNFMNHEKLSKVAETVRQNQGRVVLVKVARKDGVSGFMETYDLRLTPRLDWGGRGLLGCHLIPL